jgi:hypothetical protein
MLPPVVVRRLVHAPAVIVATVLAFTTLPEVPTDREARIDWLFDWWKQIDDWIGEHLAAGVVPP